MLRFEWFWGFGNAGVWIVLRYVRYWGLGEAGVGMVLGFGWFWVLESAWFSVMLWYGRSWDLSGAGIPTVLRGAGSLLYYHWVVLGLGRCWVLVVLEFGVW